MPPKVPSTKSASSKSSGSKAPSRGASASKTSSSKSPARGGRGGGSPAKQEAAEPKKPVVKTSELPTLSLIDEPAPKKRVVTAAKALPRIGEE